MTTRDPNAPHPRTETAPPSVTVSAEHLAVGTEWVVVGSVRVRRRIITETHTIEVALRREVFEVDTSDAAVAADGRITGVDLDHLRDRPGPVSSGPTQPPRMTFVQRREVPQVSVSVQPYERVTMTTQLVGRVAYVDTTLAHEETAVDVAGDRPA